MRGAAYRTRRPWAAREQVCYRTSHLTTHRGAVVTKHPRVSNHAGRRNAEPSARDVITALPRASTPLDRRRPSSRNHGSLHDHRRRPRRALLARAVRHRVLPRARRRALSRLPPGDGRLQEEGRAPDHHPRVHRAEGLRRGRHVSLHESEGALRASERPASARRASSTPVSGWITARRFAAREMLAARNPIPGALVLFLRLGAFFFASRPSLGSPSHPAPFASLTSRPTPSPSSAEPPQHLGAPGAHEVQPLPPQAHPPPRAQEVKRRLYLRFGARGGGRRVGLGRNGRGAERSIAPRASTERRIPIG